MMSSAAMKMKRAGVGLAGLGRPLLKNPDVPEVAEIGWTELNLGAFAPPDGLVVVGPRRTRAPSWPRKLYYPVVKLCTCTCSY